MRDDLALYFDLAPEFGGGRLGPYEGIEVRFGAHPERSHVVVQEAMGAAPDHARVLRQGDNSLLLVPAERTAAVWLWKRDARRPVQVVSATAIRPGESFSLATPDGPRFTVELAPLPPEELAKRRRKSGGRQNLTGARLAETGWSLIWARILSNPVAQLVSSWWYRIRSGAIWQPRFLLSTALVAMGMIGPMAGAGIAWLKGFQVKKVEQERDDCRSDKAYAESLSGGVETWRLDQFLGQATSLEVGSALAQDPKLLPKVQERAQLLSASPDTYAWLYQADPRVAEFRDWRRRVEQSDALDKITQALLVYAAATGLGGQHDFDILKDAVGARVCGRGPLRLTYRQARSLGLSAQIDGAVEGDLSLLVDEARRVEVLKPTALAAGVSLPDPMPATEVTPITGGASACVHAVGEDDRSDAGKVMRALEAQLGQASAHVPRAGSGAAALARITKLYAADVPGNSYVGPGSPLIDLRQGVHAGLQEQSEWPLEKAADLLARAAVLRCRAQLRSDRKEQEETFGKLPELIPCLILNYKLSNP